MDGPKNDTKDFPNLTHSPPVDRHTEGEHQRERERARERARERERERDTGRRICKYVLTSRFRYRHSYNIDILIRLRHM